MKGGRYVGYRASRALVAHLQLWRSPANTAEQKDLSHPQEHTTATTTTTDEMTRTCLRRAVTTRDVKKDPNRTREWWT